MIRGKIECPLCCKDYPLRKAAPHIHIAVEGPHRGVAIGLCPKCSRHYKATPPLQRDPIIWEAIENIKEKQEPGIAVTTMDVLDANCWTFREALFQGHDVDAETFETIMAPPGPDKDVDR